MIQDLFYFTSFFNLLFILLFTFNPDVVKVKREWELYPLKTANPDPLKCVIFSFLFSLFIFIIIKIYNKWNFKKITY